MSDKLKKQNPHGIVLAETPEAFEGLRVGRPKDKAAGLPSVISSMKKALSDMGTFRTVKALTNLNQFGGIDCQSCAWADPDDERKFAEFCENGVKAISDELTRKLVTKEFFANNSVAELSKRSDYWLNKQGRLTEPMYLPEGASHYEPVSWDKAFEIVAKDLNSLESPDEALFYTSGRTSNEAAFLYQLFVRQFGTNNLPDCSNMCHESSGTALTETIGIGKGTVTIDDFDHCDLILIIGQNPGTNHPRMMSSLERAKQNGAKIITINPLPEAGLMNFVQPNPQEYKNPFKFPIAMLANQGTALSDLHLAVKIGGDHALLKGIAKVLFESDALGGGIIDRSFVEKNTAGIEDFQEAINAVSWDEIIKQSGIPQDQIRKAAALFAKSNAAISCWAMGLTQHREAVATIQEIVSLHLMRGQIGKKGAGLCPVRGHSNVQGDRTVGIWEQPKESFLAALDREFGFTAPRKHGFDSVESIKAMHDGRAKVFFAMGGNFLSATPDTQYTAQALNNCRLTVQAITKLNRSALVTGDHALILPPLGRSEIDDQGGVDQFVTTENSMGVIQMSKGIFKPASGDLRSEPWIVAELAKQTLGGRSEVEWTSLAADYDLIREKIESTIPGFEGYNKRVREAGGFYLPNPARDGVFEIPGGRAAFAVNALNEIQVDDDQFILTTVRSHDQFNTTVYNLNDRYRGVSNERRVLFINPDDLKQHGFEAGSVLDLTSHHDGETRVAERFIAVPYEIPRQCLATYFPEANVLVPIGSVAKKSNTPTSKSIIVTISKNAGSDKQGRFDYNYVADTKNNV